MIKNFFIPILSALMFSGCAPLTHLDQLLTLEGIGANKALQKQHVKKQDQDFEKLLKVVQENKLSEHPNQDSIRRAFGDPIFVKDVEKDGRKQTKWLYRYSVKPFGSEKLYLYFDADGRLINSEYMKKPPAKDPANHPPSLTHETTDTK